MNCCIAGGGPAGIMLGYLLARQGIEVTVLEKHKDFFRDFRGDTVHPSTLEVFHELGLLDGLLQVPHQKLEFTGGKFGDFNFIAADFRHLPTYCKFIALMPQWDFLNFLTEQAKKFPSFTIRMNREATGLIQENGRVTGVEAGEEKFRADLVAGCDGRHSIIRKAASLPLEEIGVPIDVLWFRLSRHESDPEQLLGNINFGKALVLISRGDYFQVGFLIRKGSFDAMRSQGIETLRTDLVKIAPYLADRVSELTGWDQIKLLSIQINRLTRWYTDGLLCIGDAAHAMSPVGGVGINLAIQDAVAAANLLSEPLRQSTLTRTNLEEVQQRREFPAHATQFVQAAAHRQLAKIFSSDEEAKVPWQMRAALRIPGIENLLGRAVGMGARPEHITSR